jgi:hypothetical protein
MPDIYGKYSLTEIAKGLNVPLTFINRIQRETGIGGKPNKENRGRPLMFEANMVSTFKMVKALRLMDFSFPDIKELWAIEERVLAASIKMSKINEQRYDINNLVYRPLILHCYVIPDLSDLYKDKREEADARDDENIFINALAENEKPYYKTLQAFYHVRNEVIHRRGRFLEDMKRLDEELKRKLELK